MVDVCYGRRSLSGRQPTGYNCYSSSRDGANIELRKYSTRPPSDKGLSDISRIAADDLDFATTADNRLRSGSDGGESQESILHKLHSDLGDERQRKIYATRAIKVQGSREPLEADSRKLTETRGMAILRTDVVSVSYAKSTLQQWRGGKT